MISEPNTLIRQLESLIDERIAAALRHLMEQSAPRKWLTTVQAAAHAGVTPQTVRRWRSEGRLTGAGAGRELRFDMAEIDALMTEPRTRAESLMDPDALLAERLRTGRVLGVRRTP